MNARINIGDDDIGKFSICLAARFGMRDIVCNIYRFAHLKELQ